MTINYPGPYEIRIEYAVTIGTTPLTHRLRVNVALVEPVVAGTPFTGITAVLRNGSNLALNTLTDTFVGLIRPFFNTANTAFVAAELWKYTPGTFDAEFISSYNIGLGGNNAAAAVLASQAIYTFRTTEGGTMKITLMESATSQGAKILYSALSAANQALVDFLIAVNAPFLARDTSYPFSFVALYPGQNEAVFKKRLRT